MSSRWSTTGQTTTRPDVGRDWTPIPVRMVPNDMQPKPVDRAKIKAARRASRRNRRKR